MPFSSRWISKIRSTIKFSCSLDGLWDFFWVKLAVQVRVNTDLVGPEHGAGRVPFPVSSPRRALTRKRGNLRRRKKTATPQAAAEHARALLYKLQGAACKLSKACPRAHLGVLGSSEPRRCRFAPWGRAPTAYSHKATAFLMDAEMLCRCTGGRTCSAGPSGDMAVCDTSFGSQTSKFSQLTAGSCR